VYVYVCVCVLVCECVCVSKPRPTGSRNELLYPNVTSPRYFNFNLRIKIVRVKHCAYSLRPKI